MSLRMIIYVVHFHQPFTGPCDANYTFHQDSCFKLSMDQKNTSAAESACVALGGHLVAWRSQEEYDIIKGLTMLVNFRIISHYRLIFCNSIDVQILLNFKEFLEKWPK